ncbi:MAG: dienelactone hydrolase family protein [Acidobacteria bacterium]|nr:dienelactone hydrolase family protein [Acidobacteriota bacterium]
MPEITERRIIQEFPCYYDLYIPDGHKPKPLIIAMHGYGGDKTSMMKLMRRINERDYVIAALQGPHQHMFMPSGESRQHGYGFGWLTNFKPEESVALHHRLVLDIIETMKTSRETDTNRIFLVGFSQSAGVNFRFAFTHNGLVRGVVAICGGIPGDWATEGKYDSGKIDVLYIATERDEYYSPERIRQNAEALRSRARSVELRFFDATHEVPRKAYPVIDEWLARML